MGRHGTGGSEDAHDRGDSAFWGPDNQQSDSFWGRGEQPEPPGWPALPDQPEVTGQWAPMPKQDTPPPAGGYQSAPFETTGAFAVPPRPGGDQGHPQDEQPYETTGAFAPPPSWDDVPESTQTFGRLPDQDHASGHAPADPHSAYRAPQNDPFAPADPQGGFRSAEGDPFRNPRGDFRSPQDDPFGPGDPQGGFRSGQGDPFGADPQGGLRAQDDPFGNPRGDFQDDRFGREPAGEQGDPFGQEATGRFEPPSLPPEPGDVKVAGEPTMVARTPAWAEAETGFLDSGWSGQEPAQESRRGRGRRKQQKDPDRLDAPSGGGRGKLALLSVAAVVVVLGGTVAGVKMMSSPGAEASCPGGKCAAVQGSSQPGPQASEPAVEEESEPLEEDEATPEEDPTEEESRPEPTRANTQAPAPRRTATPTPKPTRTKSKAPAEDLIDEPTVEISEEEVTQEPTDTPLDVDNGSIPTQGVPQPEDTPPSSDTGSSRRPLSGGASSVNVQFNVDRQRLTGYTATMSVTNDSRKTLSVFTLSMPVKGKVLDVEGADWTQDGNLLILDMTTPIATGATADLTISATGRAGAPKSCGLVGGECAVA